MILKPLEEGAVALVTGASSGIGAAIAQEIVAHGGRVIAAARRRERLIDLQARLGAHCLPLELDVSNDGSVATLLDRLPESWRAIDILVNNAAHDVGGQSRFDRASVADRVAVIDTNVAGVIRVTHRIVPGMLERDGGQIVIIGSNVGLAPAPNDVAYITSKAAMNGFAKALRLDYLGKLRVAQVLPGIVRTEFDEVRRRGDKRRAAEFYSQFPDCLAAADVATSVLFVLRQPPHVNIVDLMIKPYTQP